MRNILSYFEARDAQNNALAEGVVDALCGRSVDFWLDSAAFWKRAADWWVRFLDGHPL